MATYTSAYTGAQIDAALGKAETALREDSPSLTEAVTQADAARDAAVVGVAKRPALAGFVSLFQDQHPDFLCLSVVGVDWSCGVVFARATSSL